MKARNNPNAPCPSAARFVVRPDSLARRGLRSVPLAVALFLMASTLASARTETLRWTHNDPSSVAEFVIYYGSSSANYTTVITVPPLQPDAQGIFTFGISVADDATIFVALTAVDDTGMESGYSNESMRGLGSGPAIGKPGTPYVISGPIGEETPVPNGEETLTVSVSTSGGGPTVSSVVTNGVGPYQFLFDCGSDGNWNGIMETSQPTASYTCSTGTSTIDAHVWDQGTNAILSEVVSVSN